MAATIPVWFGNAHISCGVQDNNTHVMAIFLLMRSSSTVQQIWKLSDVCLSDKSKMAAITGSTYETTYILVYMRDSNEIPTAVPMFSGPGNTTGLVHVRKRETFGNIDNVPKMQRRREWFIGGRVASIMNRVQCSGLYSY